MWDMLEVFKVGKRSGLRDKHNEGREQYSGCNSGPHHDRVNENGSKLTAVRAKVGYRDSICHTSTKRKIVPVAVSNESA